MPTEEIRELQATLQELRDKGAASEELVDTLNDLAFAYLRIDPELSESQTREAGEIAEQLDYPRGTGRSLVVQGLSYWARGDFGEALISLRAGLEVYEIIGDRAGVASAYSNIGLVFSGWSDHNKALDHYLAALAIYEELGDAHKIASIHNNVGIIYKNKNDDERALEHLTAAQAIFKDIGNKDGVAGIYNNLGIISELRGDFEAALDYLNKSMDLRMELGEIGTVADSYNNIGGIYKVQGDYDKALDYLLKALEIKKQVGDKQGIATTSTGIGEIHTLLKNHDLARQFFEDAMHIAEDIGAKKQLMQCQAGLSSLYESLGDFESAFRYYKRYMKLDRAIFSEDKNRQLLEIQTKFETEKKEREAEIYRQKNLELQTAFDKTDELLRNILPGQIVEELELTSVSAPRIVDNATIVFIDIVDFTLSSNESSPEKLLSELSLHFGAYDAIVKNFGLEKLKTFGDGYMYAGGLFTEANQAEACAAAALELLEFVETRDWNVRIGIHCGPCIAGLIHGWRMIYDVWGKTVNIAARLENEGGPGRVNVSQAVHDELAGLFDFEYRGEIAAHNLGSTPMYFLSDKRGQTRLARPG